MVSPPGGLCGAEGGKAAQPEESRHCLKGGGDGSCSHLQHLMEAPGTTDRMFQLELLCLGLIILFSNNELFPGAKVFSGLKPDLNFFALLIQFTKGS